METNNSDVGVDTSTHNNIRLYILLTVLIVLIASVGTVFGVRIFNNSNNLSDTSEVSEIQPVVSSDYVYFSAIPAGTDLVTPYIYQYNLQSKEYELYTNRPAHSFAKGVDDYNIFVTSFDTDQGPDLLQPAWHNTETNEVGPLTNTHGFKEDYLSGSPGGSYYTYTYMVDNEADSTDIKNWNIAIHDADGEFVLSIPEATKPAWGGPGATMYYMTTEGLRSFDTVTKETKLVYPQVTDLSWSDNFSVSPDGKTLIFSTPSAGGLFVNSLLETDEGSVFAVHNTLEEEGQYYFNPVISPDNAYFVVLKLINDSFALEIRNIHNASLIDSITLNDFVPHSIQLTNWLND